MKAAEHADAIGKYRDVLAGMLGEMARDRAVHELDREFLFDLDAIEKLIRPAHRLTETAINAAMKDLLEGEQRRQPHNLQVDR